MTEFAVDYAHFLVEQSGMSHQKRPRTVLSKSDVAEIYKYKNRNALLRRGGRVSSPQLAKIYGVGEKTIRDIWNRRTWIHETAKLQDTVFSNGEPTHSDHSVPKPGPANGHELCSVPQDEQSSKSSFDSLENNEQKLDAQNFNNESNQVEEVCITSALSIPSSIVPDSPSASSSPTENTPEGEDYDLMAWQLEELEPSLYRNLLDFNDPFQLDWESFLRATERN